MATRFLAQCAFFLLFSLAFFAPKAVSEPKTERLFAFPENGKWGFLTRDGKIAVSARFDELGARSEGMWPVRVGKKWGFVREERGFSQITPRFDEVAFFNEGLCFARSGAKWGVIGKNGVWQIAPRFTFERFLIPPPHFREGLAAVSVSQVQVNRENLRGEWGFVNRRGEWVLRPQFVGAEPFYEGMAQVSRANADYEVQEGWMRRENDTKYTFVAAPKMDGIAFFEPFLEGLAAVETTVNKRRLTGFVDREGKWAIPPKFPALLGYVPDDLAVGFRGGLALVAVGNTRENIGFGWIDKRGNWKIEPKFKGAGVAFSEGLSPVANLENGRLIGGFIDPNGEWKIEPQFEKMGYFSGGLAPVKRFGKAWEFINARGETVIPARFDYVAMSDKNTPPGMFALQFRDGLAWVREGEIEGYIDASGNWVWSARSAAAKRVSPKPRTSANGAP